VQLTFLVNKPKDAEANNNITLHQQSKSLAIPKSNISAAFHTETFFIFYKIASLNEEFNRTAPSPSVRVP
jgi:hypothetical protein